MEFRYAIILHQNFLKTKPKKRLDSDKNMIVLSKSSTILFSEIQRFGKALSTRLNMIILSLGIGNAQLITANATRER